MGASDSSTGFWNAAATTRQFTHPLDAARLRRELSADARILDFGCGQGRLCVEVNDGGRLPCADESITRVLPRSRAVTVPSACPMASCCVINDANGSTNCCGISTSASTSSSTC